MVRGKGGIEIPKVVVERMPRYYRYFDWLGDKVEKISSKKLGELMGSSASQVRLDLSYFGDFGQQGYGYNVKKLKKELANILRINSHTNIIIIGAGNIGRAITRYKPFYSTGFVLKGIFDRDPNLIGKKIDGVTIYDVREVKEFIATNNIEIAVVAVPKENANEVANTVIDSGVQGILNFAPIDLDVPKGFPVENIHIIDKILALSFIMKPA
ncbi:MAG: redox-sensing transcriptional repressor Rex [Spirochaetota bacterium]